MKTVIASEAKQSISPRKERWIACAPGKLAWSSRWKTGAGKP